MEQTLEAICEHLHGELIGDGTIVIRGVNGLELVQEDELTFADAPQHLAEAIASPAAAILVSKELGELKGRSGIRVHNSKLAFALLLELFHPEVVAAPGVHATAVLGKRVQLAGEVSIGAHVVIGDEVLIGRGSAVGAGVFIGHGSTIGERCAIDPHVTIYRQTHIGDRVKIHSGSVIGGDGFGYVFHEGRHMKVPQVGNVIIENDVELGCNVCVDRATVGSTLIRQGTKLDNLVQIAHNDLIGKHVLMAGQVGLSGTVTVGDYTVMGGKAGVVDHVTIGERAQLGAASVVTKHVPAGETVWGFPADSIGDTKRRMASLRRLPAFMKSITQLVQRLRRTETRLDQLERRSG